MHAEPDRGEVHNGVVEQLKYPGGFTRPGPQNCKVVLDPSSRALPGLRQFRRLTRHSATIAMPAVTAAMTAKAMGDRVQRGHPA